MKKVEIERLITISLFASLYPNEKGERGVKSQYIYKLLSPKAKNRIYPKIVEISGLRFIFLNEYSLKLLSLSFKEVKELLAFSFKNGTLHSHSGNKPEPTFKAVKTLPGKKKGGFKPL